MMRFRFFRPLLLALGLLLAVGVPSMAHAAGPGNEAPTKTPIKHFIMLMQENHTFDNYFGTYPGVEGIPPGTCMPVDIFDPKGQCVKPFRIGDRQITDLAHDPTTARTQMDDGKMDGFVYALRQKGQDAALTMGYYDGNDLPYYWNLADEFVLFDRFFSSAMDGSSQNHVYWTSAAPMPPAPTDNSSMPYLATIFDRLEAKGISWKFYVQNYDPTINYRTRTTTEVDNPNRLSQLIWVPLLSQDRFIDDPKLASHIVSLDQYYTDLQNGTLPEVAYMVPSGASEHPPGRIQSGEKFTRGLIQELMRSQYWNSSAFVVSYDDWGGWYDHVPPPQIDDYGLGFRVPTILVSPYARQGYIDSNQYEYSSILKFIEDNWGLQPLSQRDAQSGNMFEAFDFNQAPRPAAFVASTRADKPPTMPLVPVIYVTYGNIIILSALVITRSIMRPDWNPFNSQPPEEEE